MVALLLTLLLWFFCRAEVLCVYAGELLSSNKNEESFNFDELTVVDGFGSLSSVYHHLQFSGFTPFKPQDPALGNLISPEDYNCATSLPNAILGSRNLTTGLPAGFVIDSAAPFAHFTLLTLSVKPLIMPPPDATLYIVAGRSQQGLLTEATEPPYTYPQPQNQAPLLHESHSKSIAARETAQRKLPSSPMLRDTKEGFYERTFNVTFPSGYHLPLRVNLSDFTGKRWDQLVSVQMWVEFGYDSLDWEFCVDDIEVEFGGGEE